MGDANYPLGHYHCLEKSCWQKGFKGKRPEFSSEVRLAFCSTAQEKVKTISLVQKNIIHLLNYINSSQSSSPFCFVKKTGRMLAHVFKLCTASHVFTLSLR